MSEVANLEQMLFALLEFSHGSGGIIRCTGPVHNRAAEHLAGKGYLRELSVAPGLPDRRWLIVRPPGQAPPGTVQVRVESYSRRRRLV